MLGDAIASKNTGGGESRPERVKAGWISSSDRGWPGLQLAVDPFDALRRHLKVHSGDKSNKYNPLSVGSFASWELIGFMLHSPGSILSIRLPTEESEEKCSSLGL